MVFYIMEHDVSELHSMIMFSIPVCDCAICYMLLIVNKSKGKPKTNNELILLTCIVYVSKI